MRKLFLRVYLPLALCIIITIVISIAAMTRIIPAQLNAHRKAVEEFRDLLLDTGPVREDSILALAERMNLDVILLPRTSVRPGTPPREGFYPLPGLPRDLPWRIDVSGAVRGGPGSLIRQGIWLLVLFLLVSEGLVLFFALWPLRRRLSRLSWAASELGSGNLGIRLQTGERGDLIDQLGRSFNSMAAEIRSLVDSHQELLGMVAHELRTPLARIRLALELLREDADGSDLSKVDSIERDLVALDMLVTELLDYNRLGRDGGIIRRPLDLRAVCEEAVSAETWSGQDIDIRIRGNAGCSGDPSLLGRAIGNLVRNAVQHARSSVLVTMEEDAPSGSVRVSVEDDGPGFDPGIVERLGQPFVRSGRSGGTGLGLAIAGRTASLHGGRMLFDSSDELGGARVAMEIAAGPDRC